MGALYDRIGGSYGATREQDPRIARLVLAALGDARSVVNVGAGTGAYEPTACLARIGGAPSGIWILKFAATSRTSRSPKKPIWPQAWPRFARTSSPAPGTSATDSCAQCPSWTSGIGS